MDDLPLKQIIKLTAIILGLVFIVSAILAGIISGITKSDAHAAPVKFSQVAEVQPKPVVTVVQTEQLTVPGPTVTKTITGPATTKTVSVSGKVSASCQLVVSLALDQSKQFTIFEANYGHIGDVVDASIYAIGTKDMTLINRSTLQMKNISIASSNAVSKITNDQIQLDVAMADCEAGR